eukprot:Blabericola_migrator_1__5844@NODE_295_length_10235_cov_141_552026_g242_i0_p1_GENE_NODE_295_length_10235_cov_141_552026_g242_i0NODE_295_length_10235_cov_141_552026_g242_i0_p1_ORF_typecomplete_len850_score136_59_NODE_295_length_10235_cov_141_552026_g242_i052747823
MSTELDLSKGATPKLSQHRPSKISVCQTASPKEADLKSLCGSLLNLVLSFLDPFEVCLLIKPLNKEFYSFVLNSYTPSGLRLTSSWVDLFAEACKPELKTPPGGTLVEATLKNSGRERLLEEELHCNRADVGVTRRQTDLTGDTTDVSAIFPLLCSELAVCLRPRRDQCHDTLTENLSPPQVERSALSLLRALAQDTFLFLSLSADLRALPSWFRRCQTSLERFVYIQQPSTAQYIHSARSIQDRRGQSPMPFATPMNEGSFPTTPRSIVSFAEPADEVCSKPFMNNNLSLLDLSLLFFGSQATLRYWYFETSAHFSSFLQGPAIPRCPLSLTQSKAESPLPSSFCCIDQVTAADRHLPPTWDVHWECWSHLLDRVLPHYPCHFKRLEHLNLSGSYLPATLALLSDTPDLKFAALKRLCVKGALAVGRAGLEALDLGALEAPLITPQVPMDFRKNTWWIRDMVSCLLFAANPFRGLNVASRHPDEIDRRRYWTSCLIRLFTRERFPRLETLELKIGCGPLERRVWWCLLLTEIFHSTTLRVLEFDCTVESLTCVMKGDEVEVDYEDLSLHEFPLMATPRRLPTPDIPRTPNTMNQTPNRGTTPNTNATPRSARIRGTEYRLGLGITLFSEPTRFPSLQVIRAASAYSISDMMKLEQFISTKLRNQQIAVQVRRLHLFVQAQDFSEQCQLAAAWSTRDRNTVFKDLFAKEADGGSLTLDFSYSFPAVKRGGVKNTRDRVSKQDVIPGITRLNISRFNPLCPSHTATLMRIRFPSHSGSRDTRLSHVHVRLGLPENLLSSKQLSPGPWDRNATTGLQLARQRMGVILKNHPDICKVESIQITPSPCWLRDL